MATIKAVSVLDGRYQKLTENLEENFSEYGLIRHRVFVEIQWLKFLFEELNQGSISKSGLKKIESISKNFNVDAAKAVKKIEKKTNHDVKAVEYYIKKQLLKMGLESATEWVHFACTSEDINNTSYALMLKEGRAVALDNLSGVLKTIEELGKKYKSVPMMSRTHGQPASPTTVGKEFINFAWRLRVEINHLKQAEISAKFNGATGNYNAHCFVLPEIDWINASKTFLSNYLELTPLFFTTQINPYSYISNILHIMIRIAAILIDLDRDMWGYISLGYFRQRLKDGEVGSSTMPHKVNPIDFENSEGNMGIAISLMEHIAVKLLNSRFQRDLSDSTVLRNLGAVFGYFMIGLKNTVKGLNKIEIDNTVIQKDMMNNPELLAEPIQTVMRFFGEDEPYEKLKALTRGKKISLKVLYDFIDSLEKVPEDFRNKMKNMTVEKYTGLAEALVEKYFVK